MIFHTCKIIDMRYVKSYYGYYDIIVILMLKASRPINANNTTLVVN